MSNNLIGCPTPKPITFVQKLAPFEGKIVTVVTTGFPNLTKWVGTLSELTAQSFFVGTHKIFFDTSFYLTLRSAPKTLLPYTVNCSAEELGVVNGRLVKVGRNFVEFVKNGSNVSSIFPLNIFSEVHCEQDHEE